MPYPSVVKELVNNRNLEKIDSIIDNVGLNNTVAKYWAYVAKADIMRQISTDKKDLTTAYTLYDDVVNVPKLPSDLISWASLGKAILMINQRHCLPRGVGDRDTAFALLQEIIDAPLQDPELKQEAKFHQATLMLSSSVNHSKNYEQAVAIFTELASSAVTDDLKVRAAKSLASFDKFAQESSKNNDFLARRGQQNSTKPPSVTMPISNIQASVASNRTSFKNYKIYPVPVRQEGSKMEVEESKTIQPNSVLPSISQLIGNIPHKPQVQKPTTNNTHNVVTDTLSLSTVAPQTTFFQQPQQQPLTPLQSTNANVVQPIADLSLMDLADVATNMYGGK